MRGVIKRLIGISNAFATDSKGAVAVILAIVVALLLGFVGLAVDLSRSFTDNSEHKFHADAAAMAGASQLDGEPDAIARATVAIQNNLVENVQTFVSGAPNVTIANIRFLKTLPPDDQPITAADETIISADARFVEVTTQLEQVNT